MRIFVDAEFPAERANFDSHARSALVGVAGLPRLGQYPESIYSRRSLAPVLHDWFERFRGDIFGMDFIPWPPVDRRLTVVSLPQCQY